MHPTLVTQMGRLRQHELAQEAARRRRASPEAPAFRAPSLRHRVAAAVGHRLIAAGGQLVELSSQRRAAGSDDDMAS